MEEKNFIDEAALWKIIEEQSAPSPAYIDEVLDKAAEAHGLDLAETAALLADISPEQEERLFATALKLKETIYGNRMVLFAPLYVTNECANRCSYCAFNTGNKDLVRRSLTDEELALEVRILQDMGHKRVLAVYGEHPKWNAEAIAHSIATIYSVKQRPGAEIRRANVNCAPLDVAGFKMLKEAEVGTYQCFQETYHKGRYEEMHLGGKKKDYLWRLRAMHRAQEAGMDDVGMGVLFGLFDHRFDVLGLLRHAQALEEEFGVGPHTVSVPRIEPAQNAPASDNPPNVITDDVFKRIIAVIRLAMPYTGMIISTREKPDLKRELLRLGISQISAGSRTYPGAYADAQVNRAEAQQFWVGDERGIVEIIQDLQDNGYIPSFCTGCYRLGRTGDHFMGLAKTAFIGSFCEPNAMTSFAEYLADYAPEDLQKSGRAFIDKQLDGMVDPLRQAGVRKRLALIDQGQRDMFV